MTNLVETIQQNLDYPPLKKVDPNVQDVKEKKEGEITQLAQAAIPAVLTGLYKLTRNDEGSAKILKSNPADDSLSLLFNGTETQLVEKVAQYAGITTVEAEGHLENIADESIRVAKESLGANGDAAKLKQYMNDQRHNILVYLPASLNLGELLHDETLDDKTNKMEGPISSFMHKIENKLSQGGD